MNAAGEQMTLGAMTLDEASRVLSCWTCPTCHGAGILPNRTYAPTCRVCEGVGSLPYDPADRTEFGF